MEMALQRGDVDRTMAGGLHGAEQLRCHVEYKALVDDLARTSAPPLSRGMNNSSTEMSKHSVVSPSTRLSAVTGS